MARPLIAVVDDDPIHRRLMRELLTEAGYQVVLESTAREADALIWSRQPDLVILDLCMEQLDSGLRLLQRLRDEPATRQLPVLMCSAAPGALMQYEAYLQEQGCDILSKPFDVDDFLAKIATALGPRPPTLRLLKSPRSLVRDLYRP